MEVESEVEGGVIQIKVLNSETSRSTSGKSTSAISPGAKRKEEGTKSTVVILYNIYSKTTTCLLYHR